MSGSSGLSDLFNALSQPFPRNTRQPNRQARALELFQSKAGVGKNCAFDAEMDGATASNVAEGSDVQTSELNVDAIVPGTLSWAEYRSAFQITHQQVDAAAVSMGVDPGVNSIFMNRLVSSVNALASQMNKDLWTASGTVGGQTSLVGMLGGMLSNTGIYANINRSTYPLWESGVNASVGTLTAKGLATAESLIHQACGIHPNFMLVSEDVYVAYQDLFTTNIRFVPGMSPAGLNAPYDLGSTDLYFQGIPVIRDKDGYTGTVIMGHTDFIEKQWLPPAINNGAAQSTLLQVVEGVGSNGNGQDTPIAIPFRVDALAKTGTSYKIVVSCSPQVVCRRPNAFYVMQGITG